MYSVITVSNKCQLITSTLSTTARQAGQYRLGRPCTEHEQTATIGTPQGYGIGRDKLSSCGVATTQTHLETFSVACLRVEINPTLEARGAGAKSQLAALLERLPGAPWSAKHHRPSQLRRGKTGSLAEGGCICSTSMQLCIRALTAGWDGQHSPTSRADHM